MGFSLIRLELARNKDFPEGASNRGYELKAPLTADGHLDEEAWRENKAQCAVTRFWPGEPDQTGALIRTRRRSWAFSYEPGEEDDTPFFHLETHRFVPGEYVSIRETDGETLTYTVARVTPLKV